MKKNSWRYPESKNCPLSISLSGITAARSRASNVITRSPISVWTWLGKDRGDSPRDHLWLETWLWCPLVCDLLSTLEFAPVTDGDHDVFFYFVPVATFLRYHSNIVMVVSAYAANRNLQCFFYYPHQAFHLHTPTVHESDVLLSSLLCCFPWIGLTTRGRRRVSTSLALFSSITEKTMKFIIHSSGRLSFSQQFFWFTLVDGS